MDPLLQAINKLTASIEVLNENLQKVERDTCKSPEALRIIGATSSKILTHFVDQGFLHRTGGGKGGYNYYKSELRVLSDKIRTGSLVLPSLKSLYS